MLYYTTLRKKYQEFGSKMRPSDVQNRFSRCIAAVLLINFHSFYLFHPIWSVRCLITDIDFNLINFGAASGKTRLLVFIFEF